MKRELRIIVTMVFALPIVGYGQELPGSSATGTTPIDSSEGTPSDGTDTQAVKDAAISRLQQLLGDDAINSDLANQAIATIRYVIANTREMQDAIYQFARTVNRGLDNVDCATEGEGCLSFKSESRELSRQLLEESYTDSQFQNDNLRNQIQTRLVFLLEDIAQLSVQNTESRRDDFFHEFEILGSRFLDTRRFRLGLGIAYSYIPGVDYSGAKRIDFSPFQTSVSGGSDRLLFHSVFSDKSFTKLVLSTKMDFVQINVAFPTFSESQTLLTPVQFRDIDESTTDILTRSTINSTLDIEYDISFRIPVSNWINGDENPQFDLGLGLGVTGFLIEDTVTTDARFRMDTTSRFTDLPTGETLMDSEQTSFNTWFAGGYMSFDVSDQVQLSLEARYYGDTGDRETVIETDNVILSLSAIWFPTFNR